MYYAVPGRAAAWRRFYCQFIAPGDLAFDIGAHVGNRTAAMLAIGGRVVAVEPQPLMADTLQNLFSRNRGFHLVRKAVGDKAGVLAMKVSRQTPTVSTLSPDWIEEVQRAGSFSRIQWDQELLVDIVTLDQLIAEYGVPVFCKIDIEGFESEALLGLSQSLKALSFEYLPPAIHRANSCVDRLIQLGSYEFNVIRAEYPRFALNDWVTSTEIKKWLNHRPMNDRSGDVYARLSV
jgi:FkbM family methyltransferase